GRGAGGNKRAAQPVPHRVLEAALEVADATPLACKSHLSDHDQAVRYWPGLHVADDGQGETEVGGRLGDADAARHADEDVTLAERKVQALLEHGQDHVQAVDVETAGDPP